MIHILSLLLAEPANLNDGGDNDLIDPSFALKPGITVPEATFSYTKSFSGPSLTNFGWYAPDSGTAELVDPISVRHSFVFRTPVTFLSKVQFSIKPSFALNLKNENIKKESIDYVQAIDTVFDLSREFFDNNQISYSAKVGIIVPTSSATLINRQYISPILGHSFTVKGLEKFVFNLENSFVFNFFHEESLKKKYLSANVEFNAIFQMLEKFALKGTYETKFTSDTKSHFFTITNNLKHLIHLGVVITYFKSYTIHPFITLNAKNSFKNPSINWAITKKFF